MSYSHSQAMAQGTGTNLKLWFCFTGKDYDITIKTSHSGWRLKSFLKSQFSKVVKKHFFIGKKRTKTSENHVKIHQKVRKVAHTHTHAHLRSRFHEPVDVTMALLHCAPSLYLKKKAPLTADVTYFSLTSSLPEVHVLQIFSL